MGSLSQHRRHKITRVDMFNIIIAIIDFPKGCVGCEWRRYSAIWKALQKTQVATHHKWNNKPRSVQNVWSETPCNGWTGRVNRTIHHVGLNPPDIQDAPRNDRSYIHWLPWFLAQVLLARWPSSLEWKSRDVFSEVIITTLVHSFMEQDSINLENDIFLDIFWMNTLTPTHRSPKQSNLGCFLLYSLNKLLNRQPNSWWFETTCSSCVVV